MERLYIHCNGGELLVETIGDGNVLEWPEPDTETPPAPELSNSEHWLDFPVPAPTLVVTIDHELGFHPAGIVCLDNGGGMHYGMIAYPNEDTIQITFLIPFSGTIYLS